MHIISNRYEKVDLWMTFQKTSNSNTWLPLVSLCRPLSKELEVRRVLKQAVLSCKTAKRVKKDLYPKYTMEGDSIFVRSHDVDGNLVHIEYRLEKRKFPVFEKSKSRESNLEEARKRINAQSKMTPLRP